MRDLDFFEVIALLQKGQGFKRRVNGSTTGWEYLTPILGEEPVVIWLVIVGCEGIDKTHVFPMEFVHKIETYPINDEVRERMEQAGIGPVDPYARVWMRFGPM